MLSNWPRFTWKFLIIWFRKILKFFFRSSHHALKIYILNIFSYLKSNNFVEYVNCEYVKVFSLHLVDLVVWIFYFCLVLRLSFVKWSRYFSASENLPNSSRHFVKHKLVFLQLLHQSLVPKNITCLYFFSSNIINFLHIELLKVQMFGAFECLVQNLSNLLCQFWNNKSIPLQIWIIIHGHDTKLLCKF